MVSLPWSKVDARAELPKGVWMRNFQRTIMDAHPNLPSRALITVLYGGCGRAEKPIADEVNLLGYGSAVIRSRYPDKNINIRYRDILLSAPQDVLCFQCRYFELLPSREIRALSADQAVHRIKNATPFCE
jgi:hypothetical protein